MELTKAPRIHSNFSYLLFPANSFIINLRIPHGIWWCLGMQTLYLLRRAQKVTRKGIISSTRIK